MKFRTLIILAFILSLFACKNTQPNVNINKERAEMILDSVYTYFSVEGTTLLRETYPFDEKYIATYTAEQKTQPNPYAFLWPYSGGLSAAVALLEINKEAKFSEVLQNKVLTGLEEYYDDKRLPAAYSSYINSATQVERYYDDNVWLGLDFSDLYLLTKEQKYLDEALLIWKFIESGTDEKLGGGIYWCEETKNTKNTCSNAPGSVYALKLYEATKDSTYLAKGQKLYEWTKTNLQDTTDFLYNDHINLEGGIDTRKFAYNSGQMMQAATLLYKITKEEKYLTDAQNLAKACSGYFFHDFETKDAQKFRLLNSGNIWFTCIMFRGFVELYHIDGNKEYIDAFQKNLDYAWEHMRDANGLFGNDWSGEQKDDSKWLLTQFAMTEMYARISTINN